MIHTLYLRTYGIALLLSLSFIIPTQSAWAKAFPGAEGYGAEASGGRGGQVIHVTDPGASGPGTLQEALSTPGPRTIVFDISGVITAEEISITHGDFTLAGETAPGAGITLNAKLWATYMDTSITNFIIRHIRVRPTNLIGEQGDAIRLANNSNFILDHVSTSWGSDETIDAYQSHDFTIQWSTIEESVTFAHPKGDFHNYGLICGPDGGNVSIHHNLFAHHSHRTPAIANGTSDIINNVTYNFKRGFVHHNSADETGFNFIGNYYKAGPDDSDPIVILIDDEDQRSGPFYYIQDLYFNGVANTPWDYVQIHPDNIDEWKDAKDVVHTPRPATTRFITPSITTHTSTDAYNLVLAQAGAWPRDTLTRRTIQEVENGTGSWGRSVPADLMAGLTTENAPLDSDRDGMPDEWEIAQSLNPNEPDNNGYDLDEDYTNLEKYLHYRSDLLIHGGTPTCIESWTCDAWSDWSDCTNDSQTRARTCSDANLCGTEISKPVETETQNCSMDTDPPGDDSGSDGGGGSDSSGGCFCRIIKFLD